jgi:hypothetical protein
VVDAYYTALGPSSYVLASYLIPNSTAPTGPHTRYIDVPIPQNAPGGTYTFSALVVYQGVSSSQGVTFTVTAGTASTSGAVTVQRAYTMDTNNNLTSTFAPGQSVRLVMDRLSTVSTTVTVEARYTATGPSNYVLVDDDIAASTTVTGLQSRYIEVPIPPTAPLGTYTYTATVTYNGASSSSTATFTVSN